MFLIPANRISFALVATLAVVAARPEEKYPSRFDNFDIDRVLKTDRLFKNYFNCLMDKGKCTPEGRELKKLLPDALKTNCEKCTERQRDGTDRVLRFIVQNKPTEWEELKAKYDPEDVYVKTYREAALARGITI